MTVACERNGNSKGSWESDVIGHREGARDLQSCLA